ncbi:MAG: flagellar biosynthesis repressor FlbT [Pseudomonadota bacterium]
MPGLILKLAPGERFIANGVVIENGDRRSRLNILTPDSSVLRLRDALHPDQANTPVRKVCYIAQLVLAGEADPDEASRQLIEGIRQLRAVFIDPENSQRLARAADDVAEGRFYPALRALRAILPLEAKLIEMADQEQVAI